MDINVYSSFDDLPGECIDALSKFGEENLFYSVPWFENFISTVVQSNEQVQLYTSNGKQALLPMMYSPPKFRFGVKTLRSLANFYSTHYTILNASHIDYEESDFGQIIDSIGSSNIKFNAVNISPLSANDKALQMLLSAFKVRYWYVQRYVTYGNWYVTTEGQSFEEYCQNRSSRIRKTAANRNRKFNKTPGARFEITQDKALLKEALEAFECVYRKRWGKNEPYTKFNQGLAELAATNGWLRLGIAWLGEKPIAAQFWIVRNGVGYIYKVAYDLDFNHLSIGAVATYKMMEHALDIDKVREVDFLTGDDEYKKIWMTDRREYCGLFAANLKTPLGAAIAVKAISANLIKKGIIFFRKQKNTIFSKLVKSEEA